MKLWLPLSHMVSLVFTCTLAHFTLNSGLSFFFLIN